MVMPIDKRCNINKIAEKVPKGQSSDSMKHLISSLKYKNNPKEGQLVKSKRLLSEGYQRLGLWNDWKTTQYEAYEIEESKLDDYKKAASLTELSKIESCRGELECTTFIMQLLLSTPNRLPNSIVDLDTPLTRTVILMKACHYSPRQSNALSTSRARTTWRTRRICRVWLWPIVRKVTTKCVNH